MNKVIPARPSSPYPDITGESLWPECAANAEPIRTSDRLALVIRQMAAAGIAGFTQRLSAIAVDVRQMERIADRQVETAFACAEELARPGSNVRALGVRT